MILKSFDDIEQLVGEILRTQPETRDNPKILMLAVWARQGLLLTDMQKFFFLKCYSSESIVRAARLWQNDRSLYKPSNPQQALFMEDQYKKHYSGQG